MLGCAITNAGREAYVPSSIEYNPTTKFDRIYNKFLGWLSKSEKPVAEGDVYQGIRHLGQEMGIPIDIKYSKSVVNLALEARHIKFI